MGRKMEELHKHFDPKYTAYQTSEVNSQQISVLNEDGIVEIVDIREFVNVCDVTAEPTLGQRILSFFVS